MGTRIIIALFALFAVTNNNNLFSQTGLSPYAELVIGQAGFTTRTTGSGAQNMNWPASCAIDIVHSKLYVADQYNNRILRFSYPITVNQPIAELVFGQADFNGISSNRGGSCADNTLNSPSNVKVDATGTLWVCDNQNNRILKFLNAWQITTNGPNADVVLGQPNFTASTTGCTQSTLNNPIALLIDNSGILWVADLHNNRVLRFNNANIKDNGALADGVLGQTSYTSLSTGTAQNKLYNPCGLAIYNNVLFVSEYYNYRITRFDNASSKANGANADGVLGQSNFTSDNTGLGPNKLGCPSGITVDASGNLYVADYANHRVLIYNQAILKPNGADADLVLGQPDFISYFTNTSQNSFYYPKDITIDNNNKKILVVDANNNRVLQFDANGPGNQASNIVISNVQNSQMDIFWTNGNGDKRAVFVYKGFNTQALPVNNITYAANTLFGSGTKIGTSGWYCVYNGTGNSITVTAMEANTIYRVMVCEYFGTAGNEKYSWLSGKNNPNTITTLASPANWISGQPAQYVIGQPDFTKDSSGTSSRLFKFNAGGTSSSCAIDAKRGKIYIVDLANNRVLRFPYPINQNQPVADLAFGQPDYTSSSIGCAQNKLNAPQAVAVDLSGNLWIADCGNHRVLKFNNAWQISVNGANANSVLGQVNFTTSTGGVSQSTFNFPVAICTDNNATLWVSDAGNSRVLRFDNASSKANGANADGVLGQLDYTTNSPGLSQSKFYCPDAIAVYQNTTLFVSDGNNNRVLRFDNAVTKNNGANANGVIGQTDFNSSVSGCTQNTLEHPIGIGVDNAGTLFVADRNNHRILIYNNAISASNGQNANYVLGQKNFLTKNAGITGDLMRLPAGIGMDPIAKKLFVIDGNNIRCLQFIEPPDVPSKQADNLFLYNPHRNEMTLKWTRGNGEKNAVFLFQGNSGSPTLTNKSTYYANSSFVSGSQAGSGWYCVYSGSGTIATVSSLAPNTTYRAMVAEYNDMNWSGYEKYNTLSTSSNTINFTTQGVWADYQYAEYVIGQNNFTGNSSGNGNNKLNSPFKSALDLVHGKLYIADYGNHRVLRYSYPITGNQPIAELVLGQTNFTNISANQGGSRSASTLYYPTDITLDADGNLWVCDSYNSRVLKFNYAWQIIANGSPADLVLGSTNFTTLNYGATRSTFYYPTALLIGKSGNLWVADFTDNRVLRFDNIKFITNGANADCVLGQANFAASNSSINQNGMSNPFGLCIYNNSLFVCDQGNNRVLRFDNAPAKTNAANADAVLGQTDFVTKAGGLSSSKFNTPGQISIDGSGTLYVPDKKNNRIMIFKNACAKTNGAAADNVLGQPNFDKNLTATTQCGLNQPVGMEVDNSNNKVLVSDYANNRILQFATGEPLITTPEIQASNISFTNIKSNQISIDWIKGSGSNTAIFMFQGNSGSPTITDYSTYIASPSFGSGTRVGTSGWFCVGNGSFSTPSLTVTNLVTNTEYRVYVVDYNGTPGTEKYCTTNGINNPVNLVVTSDGNIGSNLIKIYPNPANGNFFIEFPSVPDKNTILEIYDSQGKLIKEYKKCNLKMDIDLKRHYPGVYFIKIIDGKKTRTSKLILN